MPETTLRTHIATISAYTTKDGSVIRELMHPAENGNNNQSLAEATIDIGCITSLHQHTLSEELYHITQGSGQMTLADSNFSVTTGDTICIPPGTAHQIRNTGECELKILCCCAPAYSHADTELL